MAKRKRITVERARVRPPGNIREACRARMAELGVSTSWVVARAVEAGQDRASVYRFLAGQRSSRWQVAMTVADVLGLGIVPLPDRAADIAASQKCESKG